MGPVIMAFVLVVAIPVAVLLSGMVAATILGWCLTSDGEDNTSSAELLELS